MGHPDEPSSFIARFDHETPMLFSGRWRLKMPKGHCAPEQMKSICRKVSRKTMETYNQYVVNVPSGKDKSFLKALSKRMG